METARDLTFRLRDLLRREHGALAEFLLTLAAFDERRLWAELEYAGLFDFLHRELRLSKSAAFYRKTAVALVREFPAVADALRDGKLCLMTVAEVARVLTAENAADLLPRFFGLSKREAKVLVASLVPVEVPPVRELITPVRVAQPAPALALAAPPAGDAGGLPVEPASPPAAAPTAQPLPHAQVAPERATATVEPLTAKLSRVHLTVESAFLDDYEAARAAVSHSRPNAGMAEILRLGLQALVERHAKRRGLVKRPRKTPPPCSDPDHVPAHVSRVVWKRDGGKCQWRLPSGERCGSTHCVQIDHIIPRAAGGPSTVENCWLVCAAHNDLAARRFFGDAWMDRYTARRRARARSPSRTVTAGRACADSPDLFSRTPAPGPPRSGQP
jgi:5-methylcytosine-specific restriction endonuclease McrA